MPAARATSFRVTAVIRCNIGDVLELGDLHRCSCLAKVHEPLQSRTAVFLAKDRRSRAANQTLDQTTKASVGRRGRGLMATIRGSPLLEDHLDSWGPASQERDDLTNGRGNFES